MSEITTKLAEFLDVRKHVNLDEQDCLDLQMVYNWIMQDHKILVDMSLAYKMPIAEVFYECKKAREMLAEKVKEIRKSKESA